MWLLDHNLPAQLKPVLLRFGVECETTFERGWHELRNGDLAVASYAAGFRCIVTRDVRFGESAAHALDRFPELAVILLRLPQNRGRIYAQAFESEWLRSPVIPAPGQMVSWPSR